MPIAGPSSYLPTVDEFLPHWARANGALGATGAISLAGGMDLTDLNDLRTSLVNQRTEMESIRNEMEQSRSDISRGKGALLLRLNQFNGKLRSLAPGSRWEGMLPKAFSISEGINRVIPPLEGILDLWTRYHQEEPAITLMGGYPLTDFTADLDGLKYSYARYSSAENALGLARSQRNKTQKKIYEVLRQYRLRIRSEFPEGSAILFTLPRLSPLPGAAPGTVKLTGSYNPVTGKAVLAWTPSADPAVTSLQLRACVGAGYQAEDETILTTYPASGPHGWTGTFGLGSPGSATAFKIFSITSDGSEKGSNAVTVSRPEV